jgi:hypothetical protein
MGTKIIPRQKFRVCDRCRFEVVDDVALPDNPARKFLILGIMENRMQCSENWDCYLDLCSNCASGVESVIDHWMKGKGLTI